MTLFVITTASTTHPTKTQTPFLPPPFKALKNKNMSSGFGLNGKIGRCYPLWSSFETCLQTSPKRETCFDLRDDYMECLHHKKEYARNKIINDRRAMLEEQEKKEGGGEGGGP